MVLLNKAALSSFAFQCPNSLLFFQCALCVVLVQATAWLGFIKLEPWNMKIVRVWLPVNVIFVGMIATSFFALKDLGKCSRFQGRQAMSRIIGLYMSMLEYNYLLNAVHDHSSTHMLWP